MQSYIQIYIFNNTVYLFMSSGHEYPNEGIIKNILVLDSNSLRTFTTPSQSRKFNFFFYNPSLLEVFL